MAQMDGSIGGIIYGRWRVAGMSHDEAMAQAGMGRAITGVAPAAGPLASRYQSAVPTLVVRQPARRYIPLQPLAQQRLSNGQSVPAPDPRAIDSDGTVYPHTTLGMQVSEGRFAGSRYHYRQSATFPGGRPNGYGSQLLPWGRTDWSSHPSTSTPHPVPHTHPIRMLRGIFAVPSSGPDHMVRGAGGGAPR